MFGSTRASIFVLLELVFSDKCENSTKNRMKETYPYCFCISRIKIGLYYIQICYVRFFPGPPSYPHVVSRIFVRKIISHKSVCKIIGWQRHGEEGPGSGWWRKQIYEENKYNTIWPYWALRYSCKISFLAWITMMCVVDFYEISVYFCNRVYLLN